MKQKTTKSLFLRNLQRHRVVFPAFLLILAIVLSASNVIRKSTLTFTSISPDSLLVTSDEYIIASTNPYIILFHEQGSSRGEFLSIAPKLCKMDYNCLAVDIRNGGSDNYVSNETVKRCRESRFATGVEEVEMDMLAAIEYAYKESNQPVILFGSSANGSLCLKLARENDYVRAVVALSPGEYFLPDISIRDTIASIRKPLFISSSQTEIPYVTELVSRVNEDYVTLFEPKMGEGSRGTASLLTDNKNHSEYWLALLLFFKDLV